MSADSVPTASLDVSTATREVGCSRVFPVLLWSDPESDGHCDENTPIKVA